ncbi:alpha/beta hydrolase [Maricaulaceae bacterium EIL42A08]|nr:alpha/beta hydrolase [Maricaulaceae bacterium EIL42A08]
MQLNRLPDDAQTWRQAGSTLHLPLGDCDIFYRDIGDTSAEPDRTLFLIHGYPESSFSYHKVVERLGQRFDRIVLVDFPGFGFSDKPERLTFSLMEQADALLFVWQQLKARGGHAISHDMGDSVLTELIARSVQGLMPGWFEAGLQSVTFTNGNMVMEKAALVPMQKLLRHHTLGPFLNRFTRYPTFKGQVEQANGAPMDEADIEGIWKLNALQDGHLLTWKIIRYLDERDRFQNPRWLKALSQFERPIHICWGQADAVAPERVAHHLKNEVCPSAPLTLMPGVGHFCQLQSPDEWSDAVLSFYASL